MFKNIISFQELLKILTDSVSYANESLKKDYNNNFFDNDKLFLVNPLKINTVKIIFSANVSKIIKNTNEDEDENEDLLLDFSKGDSEFNSFQTEVLITV